MYIFLAFLIDMAHPTVPAVFTHLTAPNAEVCAKMSDSSHKKIDELNLQNHTKTRISTFCVEATDMLLDDTNQGEPV